MEQSKTYLTIHLYRKDEALASIRWAILCRNHTEAVFWGLELYDSNMEDDAIQMLGTTWATCIDSFALLELLTNAKNLDRDQWCQLIYVFCKANHDSTAFYLMLRGASPTSSEWQPVFTYMHSYETIEDALKGSLRRNKLVDAWLIARCVNAKRQWAILEKLAAEKGRENTIKTIQESVLTPLEKLATAFTVACQEEDNLVSSPLEEAQLPVELQAAIQEWDAENSIRNRRVFKVRPEAITYLCERSSQPVEESNEAEIQENLEATLLASPYWKSVMKAYMKKTDRKREEFYDIFFSQSTHDIPDEWSSQDREKSHGRGLGKSRKQAFKQFINATFQRSRITGIWNCCDWKDLEEYTSQEDINSYRIDLPLKQSRKQFEIMSI